MWSVGCGRVQVIYPAKLRAGDTVRVVAPARSRALVLEHDHTALGADRGEPQGPLWIFRHHGGAGGDPARTGLATY
jgi:hypothetical protein